MGRKEQPKKSEPTEKTAITRGGEIKYQPETKIFQREGYDPQTLSRAHGEIIDLLIDNQGSAVPDATIYEAYRNKKKLPLEDPSPAVRVQITHLRREIDDPASDPKVVKNFLERGYGLIMPPHTEIPSEVKLSAVTEGGEFSLNISTGEMKKDGEDLTDLAPAEHRITQTIMQDPQTIFSPNELYAACYPDREVHPYDPNIKNDIKVIVSKIRKKLGDDGRNPQIIINHPQQGYSFGPPRHPKE